MSAQKKGDQGEYEFTRAAHDELREAEKRYRVEMCTYLSPADHRGVWSLLVVAWVKGEDDVDRRLVSYQNNWPNSQVISFGAFLYGCCHRTVRLLEAKAAATEIDTAAQSQ